jgi:hypothetical protein
MKINLRKASVIQQTILDEIKRIGTEKTTLSISLYADDVAAKLDEQLAKIVATNQKVGRLLEANRVIRASVAKKNAEMGIMDYLAEEAFLASAEHRVKAIAELEVRPNIAELAKEIEARKELKDAERSIYGRTYEVSVNVATDTLVNDAKIELARIQKRRRKIKDEMVSINVRTEIEVPEQVALVLTELGLD